MNRLTSRIHGLALRGLFLVALAALGTAPYAQTRAPVAVQQRAAELSTSLHALVKNIPARGSARRFASRPGPDPRTTDISADLKEFFPPGLPLDDAEKLLRLAGFTVFRGNRYMPRDTPEALVLSADLGINTDDDTTTTVFVELIPSSTQGVLAIGQMRSFVLKTRT